jgi:hypothetical protein
MVIIIENLSNKIIKMFFLRIECFDWEKDGKF